MPLDPSYLQRAEHNEDFLSTLDIPSTEFLDWAVTVAFYVAVRYVDAFFFPNRPIDPRERNRRVANDPRTRPIHRSYRELYNEARNARYELVEFTPFEVQSLIDNRLSHVTNHMRHQ